MASRGKRLGWRRGMMVFLAIVALAGLSLVVTEFKLRDSSYRHLLGTSTFLPRYHMQISAAQYDIRPDYPPAPVNFPEGDFDAWSNSLGCFDEPVSLSTSTPFVYLTGGSFTWGKVPLESHWGSVTQDSLGMRVLKCGVNGYGTHDELLKTERDLSTLHAPALIVVGYFASDPLIDVRGRENGSVLECATLRARVACVLQDNWFARHSVLYSMWLATMRDELRSLSQYAISDEIYEENLNNADALVSLAASKGAKILFVLIPKESHLAKSSTTVYDRIREHLSEKQVPHLDLAPLMRPYHEAGERLYWRFDSQWNPDGNRLAGLLISEYILSQGLIEVPDRPNQLESIRGAIEAFEAEQ